jgi:hypothetical protein
METVIVIKHFDISGFVTSGLVPGSLNEISDPFGFEKLKKLLKKVLKSPFRVRLELIGCH